MNDETAKKCETALKDIQWAGPQQLSSGRPQCPLCILCGHKPSQQHKPTCPIHLALIALRDETAEPPRPTTPEQQALDLLTRTEVPGVTIGTVTELAELIASHERLLQWARCVHAQFPCCRPAREFRELFYEQWEQHGKPAINKAWKPHDA